jgi:hypothetical protein
MQQNPDCAAATNSLCPTSPCQLPMNSDDEARAGLLCYLVVGEPVSMARTGNWLNTRAPCRTRPHLDERQRRMV